MGSIILIMGAAQSFNMVMGLGALYVENQNAVHAAGVIVSWIGVAGGVVWLIRYAPHDGPETIWWPVIGFTVVAALLTAIGLFAENRSVEAAAVSVITVALATCIVVEPLRPTLIRTLGWLRQEHSTR